MSPEIHHEPPVVDPPARSLRSAKNKIEDLAVLGGPKLFDVGRPIGKLACGDQDTFFASMRSMYEERQMTNNGPLVRRLEGRLAEMHEVRHCICVANACLGLQLAMRELAPQPAGEVLLPAFTYTGLPHLVVWAGLTPRFCDIDPQTHSLCPRSVEASIGERTGLILGVHHAHAPCDIDALQELSHRHQVPLLLDAAHGLGGTYRDKPLGSFGRAEVFSLHATKMINGFEGGYITTDDDELANTLRLARTFGFVRKDYVQGLGLNAKLNEVHAGLALASLDDLDAVIASNRERVEMYLRTFSSIPGVSLVPYGEEHSYNYEFNTLHVPPDWPLTRDELVSLLRAENALCWPYFSPPLYRCSTRPTGIPPSDPLPVTEALSQRFIQMPAGELTSVTDIEHIARLVSFLHDNAAAIRQALDKVV